MASKTEKWLYTGLMILMGVTGFAQMPIFKRYYIADIPGLGWLADFYLTHDIHYIGAFFLLAFFMYKITEFFLMHREDYQITPAGWVRIFFILGIVITGIFRVFKNLPNVLFSPGFTMFIDISHLLFMMGLMVAAIVFMIIRSGWLRVTHQ